MLHAKVGEKNHLNSLNYNNSLSTQMPKLTSFEYIRLINLQNFLFNYLGNSQEYSRGS